MTNTVERALIGSPSRSQTGKLSSSPRCSAQQWRGDLPCRFCPLQTGTVFSRCCKAQTSLPMGMEVLCELYTCSSCGVPFADYVNLRKDFQGNPLDVFSTVNSNFPPTFYLKNSQTYEKFQSTMNTQILFRYEPIINILWYLLYHSLYTFLPSYLKVSFDIEILHPQILQLTSPKKKDSLLCIHKTIMTSKKQSTAL